MNPESITEVGRANGMAETLETCLLPHGVMHRSMQILDQDVAYRAPVPAGLHLSCGLATLETQEPEFGTITLEGRGLIAMLCTEDRPHFATRIAAGHTRSCGLFVPFDAGHDVSHLDDIAHILSSDNPVRTTGRVPADLIVRACTAVDPWFQGDARRLVMEARALELTALFWTWLHGREAGIGRPALHAKTAARARDILEARLTTPPTLTALAKMVGVNVRTLTAAFREAYATSIATYVTMRRLETAEGYLRTGMSVSSAAYQVGYTPAHFSNAYLRHFGIRPQCVRRSRFPMA